MIKRAYVRPDQEVVVVMPTVSTGSLTEYQNDEGHLFDGHAVLNGPQHPPAPTFSALRFRGTIFSDGPAPAAGR